ncbi:MAG: DUF2877 domain-containing protein [Lachnospiraceae bacterium]|nr:DUF2877 domain-containing protein [Lachnospiraceae bacterium]
MRLRIFDILGAKTLREGEGCLEGYIEELSLYADGLLRSQSAGYVHSVYRKTVNLSVGGRLLSLQPADSPLSPISLITNASEGELRELRLTAGEPVWIGKDRIQTKEAGFFAGRAVRRELLLAKAAPSAQIERLEEDLCGLLKKEGTGTFCRAMLEEKEEGTDLLLKTVKDRLADARARLGNGMWEEAAESLAALVGLGIGLTPGGDDFLCGVLAGIRLGGRADQPFFRALHATVSRKLDQTNDISREFLKCALEGQFGQFVHRFYKGSTEEIFAEAKKIGHSSGMDTLCGILYALWLREWLRDERGKAM